LTPALSSRPQLQFRKILIPTVDTVRYSHLLSLAVQSNYPCLFVGPTGTGKSVYVLKYINSLDTSTFVAPIVVGLSSRTSAATTQHMIDAKLDRRRKGVYGPTAGKKVVCFVDDLNMPQPEHYGAQPPIEILRQVMDHGGWCVHSQTEWK
jgi:dynein heavy chain